MEKQIRDFAKSQGFDLVGFSPVELESKHIKAFNNWLEQNYEGSMAYMRKKELRENIGKLLPRARTVISLAFNYYRDQSPLKKNHGRIARYAYGRDYHKIILKKLRALENFIRELAPEAETRSYVDTGPILERAYAEQAGIGFIGKNACLITPTHGSWVFLSEIITTLPLKPDRSPAQVRQQSSKDFAGCGGCTKCIEACPTGAIIAPGVIDSTRCISYLTIENKDEIPPELAKIIKKTQLLYGCDICQEVCPHNSRQKPTTHAELSDPKIAGDQIPLKKISQISTAPDPDSAFLKNFAGSPLMRAKRRGLERNSKVLL